MRRFPASSEPPPPGAARGDWRTIKSLLPYLLAYKWRVALALSFLIAAKVANLGVPMVMKRLIDAMNVSPSDPRALLVVPVGIIIGY
ncbi:MAG: metal ABC transporter permease, partial [Ralstonia pickettii]|nr:metal ABC transporter permease [Ralstonia pickettii]